MVNIQHEARPLLASDQRHLSEASEDATTRGSRENSSSAHRTRMFLQRFLTSKYGYYFVIILVSLDVCGIFATFLISLHMCEHSDQDLHVWKKIDVGLEALSLTFSCLFMAELLCSVYAFGPRYFRSKFHCFDAFSILASFLVDVLTHGPVKEAGSLIIVLRFFRIFKIIEESSTVAEESLDELKEKVSELEKENKVLRQRQIASSNPTEEP